MRFRVVLGTNAALPGAGPSRDGGPLPRRAEAAGITLDVSVFGKLPAKGDAGRTGQLLAALIDNAVRVTPDGGRVSLTGAARDGCVEAVVADTGPGIPPDHLRRIFDRFHRADAQSAARTRGEAGGGTGLGLTIARDLARAQGGELTAGNARAGEAELRISLPGR